MVHSWVYRKVRFFAFNLYKKSVEKQKNGQILNFILWNHPSCQNQIQSLKHLKVVNTAAEEWTDLCTNDQYFVKS